MTLQSSRSRLRGSWLTFVLLVAVLCLGVWAPAVGTQGAPPAPAAAGPTPAQAPGRGDTGRVGGARGPMADPAADLAPKTPYLPRAAADEQRTFMLPAGYRMELIASDPDVINPVVIEFDGNGRMYVAEMTSYMLDAEATREHDPISRISRWESTKGDGVFDRRTVFVDTLVAPRMILPLQDGVILTSETDSDELVRWSDTNGDGVADRREVVFTGIGQSGDANIEHQKAGLVWNMDNWIYTTYNPFRIRWTPAGFLREPTGPNGGQWGLASDDDGKPWFVDAGGERGPMNFQFPIHYGAFTPCPAGRGGAGARAGAPPPAPDPNCPASMENGFEKDFAVVWPAPSIGDMQGGLNRIRMPFQNLNHFTAASGPAIFRGHRLPDDLKGQLLFPEPVGRLIRRAAIDNIEGLTQLRNVYPSAEFITAGDQLFRPVNISNAPDGTLYIADMYHGIIQERQWSGPGTYLRAKIEQYRLDTVVNHGRIWRLRYDGRPAVPATATNIGQTAIPAIAPDFAPPRMYQETPAQLVAHLSHPNGWWRDMAQRLLVLSQDKTLAPTLEGVARSSDVLVARFHALWTLEGIGALTGRFVRELMEDPHPRMRIQAIRASETLFKAGDRTLADQYRAATRDPDVNVVIQGMLTASLFKLPDAPEVIRAARANTPAKGVALIADRLLTPGPALGGGRRGGALRPDDLARLQQGSDVYQGVCFACHGSDGQGAPSAGEAGATMAPAIAGSPRIQAHRDYVIKVLLHGLTGPVGGRTYGEVMVPMGGSSDEWVAGVASYVRTSFGNTGDLVTPADVARVRKATAGRKTPWTYDELAATLPRALDAQQWTLSASHNPGAAGGAATLRGWTSGGPQQAGMWFQIGLPQPALVTELQFDSAAAPGAAGRGGPGAPVGPPVYGAPVSYEVVTSIDGRTWSTPVASGTGTGSRTTITLPPTRARFIRLVQTGAAGNAPAWSILGLRVFEVPAPGAAR